MSRTLIVLVLVVFCTLENLQSYRISVSRHGTLANNQLFGRGISKPVDKFQFHGEVPSSSALQMSSTSGSKRQGMFLLIHVFKLSSVHSIVRFLKWICVTFVHICEYIYICMYIYTYSYVYICVLLCTKLFIYLSMSLYILLFFLFTFL